VPQGHEPIATRGQMGGMGRYACTVAVVPLGQEDKKSAMMEACDDLHDADSRVLTTEMACSAAGIAYQARRRSASAAPTSSKLWAPPSSSITSGTCTNIYLCLH